MSMRHSESSGRITVFRINDNYFVGVTLPCDLKKTIEGARGWMRERWGNRSGMKTECHITLVPPFYSEKPLSEIRRILSHITTTQVSIHVSGWGSFGLKTIFACVERRASLETLQKEVSFLLKSEGITLKSEKKFVPHITVANRDIKPESFIPSMEYLNSIDIDYTFSPDSVMIFTFDRSWKSEERGRVRFSF